MQDVCVVLDERTKSRGEKLELKNQSSSQFDTDNNIGIDIIDIWIYPPAPNYQHILPNSVWMSQGY